MIHIKNMHHYLCYRLLRLMLLSSFHLLRQIVWKRILIKLEGNNLRNELFYARLCSLLTNKDWFTRLLAFWYVGMLLPWTRRHRAVGRNLFSGFWNVLILEPSSVILRFPLKKWLFYHNTFPSCVISQNNGLCAKKVCIYRVFKLLFILEMTCWECTFLSRIFGEKNPAPLWNPGNVMKNFVQKTSSSVF